jgi:hypothetical protein
MPDMLSIFICASAREPDRAVARPAIRKPRRCIFRLLDRVWEGRRLDDPPTRYGFQQLEGQAKIEQAGTPRSVSGFAQKKMPGQPRHMLTPPFFNPNRPLAG